MTTLVVHPRAAAYLQRLRAAARRLPRARREELIADIEAHLAEAIPADASEAHALNVIERLGEPEEIVAAEDPAAAEHAGRASTADARGTREWAAVILLLFGGFIAGVGWLAGLILLWSSRNWSIREKWLGTLVVPGGWAGAALLALIGNVAISRACVTVQAGCGDQTSLLGRVVVLTTLAVLVLGPLGTAIFLAQQARTPPEARS